MREPYDFDNNVADFGTQFDGIDTDSFEMELELENEDNADMTEDERK